jgi:xanthine dehydrogenase YagR molybdenum-binding subunit
MQNKHGKLIGEGVNRIDGILKVTGTARYATDYPQEKPAYAVMFKSTIAAGRISEIDTTVAEKSPGVLKVVTHKNALKLAPVPALRGGAVLQDDKVEFNGQHIGFVVAETFEQARAASRVVKVTYEKSEARTDFNKNIGDAALPKAEDKKDAVRGDVAAAMAAAEVKLDEVYATPMEHHQPMEPHSTVAVWDGPDKLTIYNPSQIVSAAQDAIVKAFALKPENARVITPHIGGGFGSKGGIWGNTILAAMAAKMVGRPVKMVLTRQQMFNSVGLRQRNQQHIRMAATKDGKLTAISHETTTHTATNGEFVEGCGDCTKIMYDSPNSSITYKVTPMNVILPTFTRGPGKSTGSFALESAIDELAYKLKMDPIELRLKNLSVKDPSNGKPFSSRSTAECLKRGAEAFGWSKRKAEPRTNRDGAFLIGHGVACGTYPSRQQPSSARVKLTRKGDEVEASIELAASDLGTGTHTILAQTAADALGLPMKNIGVKIGDSSLPPAAGSVGSVGAASFSNAVNDACVQARNELQAKSGKQYFVMPTVAQLMSDLELTEYETRADAKAPAEAQQFSSHAFNANFCEVRVNEHTGMVRVSRFTAVTGAGRIINPKTSRSQIIGGVTWGIGMALHEESLIDPRWGNFITRTFADYHVASNLDVGDVETLFVEEDDKAVNKLGVKGIGEVGIVSVAAAVANAVFNATGKRVRSLPITPDKLL